jgi:hypothetical protein
VIRYGYTSYSGIPAPFVHVTIRCPQSGKTSGETPAQVDSAADCTVVPGKLFDELQLVSMAQKLVSGLGGQVHRLPVYRVDVAIRSMPAVPIKVVRSDEEPVVLLGRDVLNQFRVLLDGPGKAVEIE